eukprot:SAG31_NODE_7065_length_1799_cov_1.094118_2_plen_81_part_01
MADKMLGQTFIFCLAWSIGGNATVEGMDEMEDFIRNTFDGKVQVPPAPSLFEMFVDTQQMKMVPWTSIVPKFEYKPIIVTV